MPKKFTSLLIYKFHNTEKSISVHSYVLFIIILILSCFFTILFFTFVKIVHGQVPPPYIECKDKGNNQEWHSLRPYQASPCKIPIQDEQSLLCGSDLIVRDEFPADPTYPRPMYYCENNCNLTCCGKTVMCYFADHVRRFDIITDASGDNGIPTDFPIAGNTELIKGDEPLNINLFNDSSLGSLVNKIIGATAIDSWRLKEKAGVTIGSTTVGGDPGFDQHPPPDITQYKNYKDYYEAYMEWRGKACISTNDIPIIGKFLPDVMLCTEAIGGFLNPNFWADLYPKIPYSSTEDRIGKYSVSDMIWDPPKSNIDNADPIETDWREKNKDDRTDTIYKNESALYFSHMEETLELSSLLQSTYLPQELLKEKQPIGQVESIPQDQISTASQCKILEVRSNPGDKLFGEEKDTEGRPAADVTYYADYKCHITFIPTYTGCKIQLGPDCIKYAVFHSNVETDTPLIDEVWSKTVAGNASVFKRFYPQVTTGSAVEKIKDIPAKSGILYDTPGAQLLTQDPTLYFPHLGGIYDYFIEGIETLLRPKGFAAKPLNLQKNQLIIEANQANEYLSWFLNGTIYRSEQKPLDISKDCIGESTQIAGNCSLLPIIGRTQDGRSTCYGLPLVACWVTNPLIGQKTDTLDRERVVNQSGPLNKLLSQQSQWRNTFQKAPDTKVVSNVDRVSQPIPRAQENRHNQIVGCTWGIKLPINIHISWPFPIDFSGIGGFPTACKSVSQSSLPPPVPPGDSKSGECTDRTSDLAKATTNSACKLTPSTINGVAIPDNMRKVFEAAGAKNNVPPDLIAGVMFSEGGFEPRVVNPSCYGDYSEENINEAIRCEFPNCDPADYNPPCNYSEDAGGCNSAGPYQNLRCPTSDPNEYNRCNFYDATMGVAAKLARDREGIPDYSGSGDESTSCINYNYNTGDMSGSASCQKSAWTCSDVITAIRFETGSCLPTHFCDVLKVYGTCNLGCGSVKR